MKVSIVIAILNSHEIVRRQILHYRKLNLPGDVEILFMDDGSEPPLYFPEHGVKNLSIHATGDTRMWTWAIARNKGARLAKGDYLLMTDIDYIISAELIEAVRCFSGDKMGFKREFGVLDESGNFTQELSVLLSYGLLPDRIHRKGVRLPAHPNNFAIRKDLYWEMGGYREDRIGATYPQGEDRWFKKMWTQFVKAGRASGSDISPTIYMFPNGQFCGDVDYNPFGLFHNLSRKSS